MDSERRCACISEVGNRRERRPIKHPVLRRHPRLDKIQERRARDRDEYLDDAPANQPLGQKKRALAAIAGKGKYGGNAVLGGAGRRIIKKNNEREKRR